MDPRTLAAISGRRRGAALYSAGPFSSSNYLSATGAGPQAGTNTTFAMLFYQASIPAADTYPWGFVDASNGWFFGYSTAYGKYLFFTRGLANFAQCMPVTAAECGLVHCIAVANDGTNWRYSVDGGAVQTSVIGGGAASPAIGTTLHQIGKIYAGGAFDSGQLIELAAWNARLSDADLQRASAAASLSAPRLPSDLEASATFLWSGSDLNGSGTSTSRGSSPVTFTVNGTVAKNSLSAAKSIDVSQSSLLFADNSYDVPQTGADGRPFRRRTELARISVVTDATQMVLRITGGMVAAGYSQFAHIAVYVDGVFSSIASATLGGNVEQGVSVTLPAGSKTVTLIEGTQANPTTPTVAPVGTFITSIQVPQSATLTPVTPTSVQKRLVVYGDSITGGGNASVPARFGWVSFVRADFPTSGTGGVVLEAWGSRSLNEDYLAGGNSVNALADKLAALCDGTTQNTIWLSIGTNDYGLSRWSAASFQAAYTALLTALRARTTAPIYCQTPIARVSPASEATNAFGNTLSDYRTGIASAVTAAAIANCTLVSGSAFVSSGNYDDGVHPNNSGHLEYKNAVKTTLAY